MVYQINEEKKKLTLLSPCLITDLIELQQRLCILYKDIGNWSVDMQSKEAGPPTPTEPLSISLEMENISTEEG